LNCIIIIVVFGVLSDVTLLLPHTAFSGADL
jgi:hypothetical protein